MDKNLQSQKQRDYGNLTTAQPPDAERGPARQIYVQEGLDVEKGFEKGLSIALSWTETAGGPSAMACRAAAGGVP